MKISGADFLETAKSIFAVVGPLIGTGGIWAYLVERQKARAPRAVADSQALIADALADQYKLILDEHTKDRNDLRRIVVKQGKRLTKLARDVEECNKHHRNCEAELAEVKARIECYLSEPPAPTLVVNPHALQDQFDAPD